MDLLILERRHTNGVVAQVYRDDESAGYRAATIPTRIDREEPEWPYFDSIDAAQAEADALAHPGCTGAGCRRWGPAA
ncbi:MAG: hypothetical protein ABR606_11850 [Vicinamibacterales bacterium]